MPRPQHIISLSLRRHMDCQRLEDRKEILD